MLTDNTSGGGSGGTTDCNWLSGIDLLTVVNTEFGTRCGNPQSFEVTLQNTSNIPLKTGMCLQKTDGTWYSEVDGTFENGFQPGASRKWWICEGTGSYQIWSMPLDDYLANSCLLIGSEGCE